jgi:hypothetical protein
LRLCLLKKKKKKCNLKSRNSYVSDAFFFPFSCLVAISNSQRNRYNLQLISPFVLHSNEGKQFPFATLVERGTSLLNKYKQLKKWTRVTWTQQQCIMQDQLPNGFNDISYIVTNVTLFGLAKGILYGYSCPSM